MSVTIPMRDRDRPGRAAAVGNAAAQGDAAWRPRFEQGAGFLLSRLGAMAEREWESTRVYAARTLSRS